MLNFILFPAINHDFFPHYSVAEKCTFQNKVYLMAAFHLMFSFILFPAINHDFFPHYSVTEKCTSRKFNLSTKGACFLL